MLPLGVAARHSAGAVTSIGHGEPRVSVADVVSDLVRTIQPPSFGVGSVAPAMARLAIAMSSVMEAKGAPNAMITAAQWEYLRRMALTPALAIAQANRLMDVLRSAGGSEVPGPLCIDMTNPRAAECFLDWNCTKESYTTWWGFVVCVCNIFQKRNCPCECFEIEWVDVLLLGVALALLKNPRLLIDLAKWLIGRGASPVPVPIPIPAG